MSSRAAIGLLPDTARVTGSGAARRPRRRRAVRQAVHRAARQGHRDGVPGTGRGAGPAVHRRLPDQRGHPRTHRRRPKAGPGQGDRSAAARAATRSRTAVRLLSASAVRRAEAARGHRLRYRLRPGGDPRRRADHRAGCHGAGRNPGTVARPAGSAGQRHRADHPQHGGGRRPGRPGRRHERGQGRRNRDCGKAFRRAVAGLHPHSAGGGAAPRAGQPRTPSRRRDQDGKRAGDRSSQRRVPGCDRLGGVQGGRRRHVQHRPRQDPWPGGGVGLGQVHDRALRCGAAEADDRYGQDSRPGHHRHDREAAPAGAREVRLRVPGSRRPR